MNLRHRIQALEARSKGEGCATCGHGWMGIVLRVLRPGEQLVPCPSCGRVPKVVMVLRGVSIDDL
jgi:hypothetical protein